MAIMNGMKMTLTDADNGRPCPTGELYAFSTISAQWKNKNIPAAGTLAFTVDGKTLSDGNSIDLASDNPAISVSDNNGAPGFLAFCEVTPTGLPAGAIVTLYFR